VNKKSSATTAPEWLSDYQARGFKLVYYATKTKGPREKDWTTKTYTPEDYRDGQNVGIITGVEIKPGQFLVDIDFDWPDGIPLSPRLLPNTNFGFGRASRPVSHAFYTVSEVCESKKYEDIDGKVLVELRCAKADKTPGFQTMSPPSIHPNGESITLRNNGPIGHADSLPRRLVLYAVSCLFLSHLQHRQLVHDTRLALTGFLLQCGCTEEETIMMGEALAEATHNEVKDIAQAVGTTAQRLARSEKVHGRGQLAKLLGDDGKKIVNRALQWLGSKDFLTDKKNDIAPNQENIRRAFEKMGAVFSFNTFSQKAHVTYNGHRGVINERLTNHIRLRMEQEFSFLPVKELYYDVLEDTAYENSYHPVLDYLTSLKWDETPRLNTWLIDAAGAGKGEYTEAVGSLVLLAAVKRILEPGCKFDEMLVLESGQQGLNKSSALRALCPEESWFSDDLPLNVEAKQIIEMTQGKWIIEASDLSGMSPKNVEALKAMLSRQVDGPVRMAYGRLPSEQPRQWIIIGTTNSYEYLTDITGNRRFWPVRIRVFDIAWITAHRDQLWAEAYARVKAGASIRLDESLWGVARIQQERRRAEDPWEAIFEANLGKDGPRRIAPDELFEMVGILRERQDYTSSKRIAACLQLLGFRRGTVTNRQKQVTKGWIRGESQRDGLFGNPASTTTTTTTTTDD
jgi:predicted P-loop ATPase